MFRSWRDRAPKESKQKMPGRPEIGGWEVTPKSSQNAKNIGGSGWFFGKTDYDRPHVFGKTMSEIQRPGKMGG